MTRLARIWSRLFGYLDVNVFGHDDVRIFGGDEDVVWCWHSRGVLHCYSLYYGGKWNPMWELTRTHIPLSSIEYWTRERI